MKMISFRQQLTGRSRIRPRSLQREQQSTVSLGAYFLNGMQHSAIGSSSIGLDELALAFLSFDAD